MRRIKELGVGAFGTAYLYEDDKGKYYVVKEIRTRNYNTIRHEVEALEKIKSKCNPYLVCVDEVKQKNGVYHIIMEYVPDTFELFEYLDLNFKKMKPEIKITLIMNLVKGLIQLHNLGVVHRDIKPENILFNPNTLNARYIDYGTSCVKEEKESNCGQDIKKPVGTELYFSPEILRMYINFEDFETAYLVPENDFDAIWRAKQADDIWALGVTIGVIIYHVDLFYSNSFLERLTKTQESNRSITNFLAKYKRNPNTPFAKLVKYILNPDWRKRPTAKQIYKRIKNMRFGMFLKKHPKLSAEEIRSYDLYGKTDRNTKLLPRFFSNF